jgi:hypothetical protein
MVNNWNTTFHISYNVVNDNRKKQLVDRIWKYYIIHCKKKFIEYPSLYNLKFHGFFSVMAILLIQ